MLQTLGNLSLLHDAADRDRDRFDQQLERTRWLTLRAVARAQRDIDDPAAGREFELAASPETPRARLLADRLGLDRDELRLVWCVVACTVDPYLAPHAVALAGTEARRGASLALFATVESLTPERVRGLALRLGPTHPLLRLALLEAEEGNVPALSPLRASRRLCRYLAGDDTLDHGVSLLAVPPRVVTGPDDEQACVQLASTFGAEVAGVVVVSGPRGVGRRTVIARAAASLERKAVAIDLARLGDVAALEAALAGLRREIALGGAVPVVAGVEDLGDGGPDAAPRIAALQRFLDDVDVTVALVTEGASVPVTMRRPPVRVSLAVPPASVRRAGWEQAACGGAAVDELAVRYRLGMGGIAAATEAARAAARARRAGELGACDLVEGVRATIGDRFGDLARRLDVPHQPEDLVVSDDVKEQLDLVSARVRHAYEVLETWGFRSRMSRGAGVAVLLSGPSGTGKTMIAGLLARALDLELYQVDLSKIVSKWMGETEKNLSRVLDAAEAGHALLLFDEADSLFSKRTEVKGSNDRSANLEVNHLLQRIESFGGVAVLTTNMETAIDPAMKRRLAAHIVIPRPGAAERAALWQRLLTRHAPVAADIDFDELADEFADLTGGYIRNAVVSAAFLAASQGTAITQAHLSRAGGYEYRAMGRVCFKDKGRE